jgi:hypothetical protein
MALSERGHSSADFNSVLDQLNPTRESAPPLASKVPSNDSNKTASLFAAATLSRRTCPLAKESRLLFSKHQRAPGIGAEKKGENVCAF